MPRDATGPCVDSMTSLSPLDRLTHWLWNRQTWTLELFLAVQSLVWGAWLLMPWDSFGVIPGAYTVLAVVPEWLWGLLFAGHGIAHLLAIYLQDVTLCRRASLALAGLWLVVVVSLLLTIPLSTAIPIYSASVLGAAWVYVSLDHRFGAR